MSDTLCMSNLWLIRDHYICGNVNHMRVDYIVYVVSGRGCGGGGVGGGCGGGGGGDGGGGEVDGYTT